MVRHPLTAAGRLYPADIHPVDQFVPLPDHLVLVEMCIEPQRQRPLQSIQARPLRQVQKLFDAARLNPRIANPRLAVVVHGLIHAELPLNGLKPHPIQGQPVFGHHRHQIAQLLFGKFLENLLTHTCMYFLSAPAAGPGPLLQKP